MRFYPCSCSVSNCAAQGSMVTFRLARKTEIALFLRFSFTHNCKFCEVIEGCSSASFLYWIIPEDVFFPLLSRGYLFFSDEPRCSGIWGIFQSLLVHHRFIYLPRGEEWLPREFCCPSSGQSGPFHDEHGIPWCLWRKPHLLITLSKWRQIIALRLESLSRAAF